MIEHAEALSLLLLCTFTGALGVLAWRPRRLGRCAFCWRPAEGSIGFSADGYGATIPNCRHHVEDAHDLAYGRAVRMRVRAEMAKARIQQAC